MRAERRGSWRSSTTCPTVATGSSPSVPTAIARQVVTVEVSDGRGTAGGALDGAFGDVSEVRLLDERGREVADAALGGS